jgi:hypothetical protein
MIKEVLIMANILDRYGIKEVADVTFYKLDSNGVPMYPVLYLDTLKVSTIEQTAETTDARGGKGNAKLISWDYNKEITVTLEDALFSAKSLAIMFGNGSVGTAPTGEAYIMKTETFVPKAKVTNVSAITYDPSTASTLPGDVDTASGWNYYYVGPNGKKHVKNNVKFYEISENGSDRDAVTGLTALDANTTYYATYDLALETNSVIEVSANSFPGTYYVTGDTFARNEASGEDEFFQFIIPKAKVTSENTITLEAEGDPSVFNMNLTVLRPADGVMMKLVKYDLTDNGAATISGSQWQHVGSLEEVTSGHEHGADI